VVTRIISSPRKRSERWGRKRSIHPQDSRTPSPPLASEASVGGGNEASTLRTRAPHLLPSRAKRVLG
jgi:hypothetical protein